LTYGAVVATTDPTLYEKVAVAAKREGFGIKIPLDPTMKLELMYRRDNKVLKSLERFSSAKLIALGI
jgi:hypothetical protein